MNPKEARRTMTDAEYQRYCADRLAKKRAKREGKRDRDTSVNALNAKRKSVHDRPNGHPYY